MNTELRDCLTGIKKAAIDAHIKCQDLSNNGFMKLMTAEGEIFLCIDLSDTGMSSDELFQSMPIVEQVCDIIVEALEGGTFRLVKNRDNKIPANSCFNEDDLRMLLPQWWKRTSLRSSAD